MSHKNLLKRCYHNWMFRRLRKRLQLDLAQQQKLEQLKLELESCGTTCQSSRHAQRDDLAQLLEEERLDRERASDMLQTRVNRIESHGQKLLSSPMGKNCWSSLRSSATACSPSSAGSCNPCCSDAVVAVKTHRPCIL